MPYALPSFDELLDRILTDYRNQTFRDANGDLAPVDTSQGSLVFIKSACMASALWGLYRYQEWISRQIFPDTSDSEILDHHAWVRGLSRTYGETDPALLARLLDYIRRPPAGGNKYDYVKWALTINNVAAAYCYPIAQGLGTVDVVIVANLANTGSEVPSSSARTGLITSVTAGKLIDSGATFSDANAVAVGDVVENPVTGAQTYVTHVDSGTQLDLYYDIFHYVGETYIVHAHTGTSTTVATGKLIDSAGAFTNATYTLKQGDVVENLTDGTSTTAASVDSATQLTLTDDIFTATGKKYVVRGLASQVKSYIDGVRPVTASRVNVIPAALLSENVTITASGSAWNPAQAAADIAAFMNGLVPNQTLFKARLTAIAVDNGADSVTITTPAADVTATEAQMIRPGVINVT